MSLHVTRTDGVVRCALNRPPLNLLDAATFVALRETFTHLARDATVRVAVLSGRGRAFTAGMDVRVLRDLDAAGAKALITTLHEGIAAVHDAPFPTIAEVTGPCLGAGFELAMACDLRVAEVGASFGLPEVRVGVPSVIEAALLPALIGPGRAAELLLCGSAIAASIAHGWGLINRVSATDRLRETTDELVGHMLACGPRALRLQKELMIRWRATDLPTAVRFGINAFVAAYASGEPREGASAFLEKRAPRFEAPT